MTTILSAAHRMPRTASVAVPAPLALGISAEPCAHRPALLPANPSRRAEIIGDIVPAIAVRRGGKDGSGRFGGSGSSAGSAWYRQDSAQLAGGGPLRG